MCDPKKSLERAQQAREAVAKTLAQQAVDDFRLSRLCVNVCTPQARAQCHAQNVTPRDTEKCVVSALS